MPGAFKLDHLQPIEPILSQNIFNFYTFLLGGQLLLPQRAIMEKREFIQLQYNSLFHPVVRLSWPIFRPIFSRPITDIIRKMLCARTALSFSADISDVFSSYSLITCKLIHFSVQCESPRLMTRETSQQILSILSPSLNLCSGRREKNQRHGVWHVCAWQAGK